MGMEITKKNAKMWSRMGPRATYGLALHDVINRNDRVYALSGDLGSSSGLSRIMTEKPERYLNVGIAEQNLIGVSAGLAKEGLIPFSSSFAPFITHRCEDQIRMNMGYMHLNIKTVGLGSGVSMSILGNSHYGLSDLAIMTAIPGMTIVSPCDCAELAICVEATAEYEGPVYIRLTGTPGMPRVYESHFSFEIGKAIKIREGDDIAIIATGTMVYFSIVAADILSKNGIEATVIDMHTIKPLDNRAIDDVMDKRLIVTVEEASIVGGLGSAVAEYIAIKRIKPAQLMLGLRDCFPHAGSYQSLLEQCRLTGDQIAEDIQTALHTKN